MDDNQHDVDPQIQLAGPQMSEDNGIASLGLIMQLAGTIFLGLMTLIVISTLFAVGSARGASTVLALMLLGLVRSGFHRAAGTAILYSAERSEFNPRGPLKMMWLYVIIAFVHSGFVLAFMDSLHMTDKQLFTFGLMLVAWPATLAVMFSMSRFKQYATRVPIPCDRGFEGVSILMMLFGVVGAMCMGFMLLVMFELPGEILQTFEGMLMLATMAVLLVRSVQHVRAGYVGFNGPEPYQISDAANRYISWGIGSSLLVGGVLMLMMLSKGGNMAGMFTVVLMAYLLMAWPLLIRRFFVERNFAVVLEEEEQQYVTPYQRAPDMGMTSLGWLLLALGVLNMSSALPGALFGPEAMLGSLGGQMDLLVSGDLASKFGRTQWWSVLGAGVQLWAAWELITMSKRWKMATFIYGAVAALMTLYVALPMFENLDVLSRSLSRDFTQLMVLVQVGLALAIPVGAMILANRQPNEITPPSATAKIAE